MKNNIFLIFKVFKFLSNKRKIQFFQLLILMLLSGISELIVINAVIPFLAVITNPEQLSNYRFARVISDFLNIPLNAEIILPFILVFALSVLLSTLFRLISLWASFNLTASVGNDLSSQCFSKNIYQPYEYHLNNSSSKLITSNTIYVNSTVASFSFLLTFIYCLILTTIIAYGILIINPKLTIISIIIFTLMYLFLGKKFKRILAKSSTERAIAGELVLKSLQEGFGSIRNVLLESNQHIYVNNFKKFDNKTRRISAKTAFISDFPRYAIECMALVFIAFASIFISKDINDRSSIIISLGAFTLGLQKLLPAFQRIYSSLTYIRGYGADLEKTVKILEMKDKSKNSKNISPLKFKKSIRFESVFFSYIENKCIISNLDLEIFKGEKIGIIGKTGSGKTTTSDLIMGLLKPTKGKIYVDDKDIHDKYFPNRINKWMRSISHVPQNIYLTDTSIAENIAFGISKSRISIKRIKECAKKAQIHEFIESTKNGYLTKVGERGVRLSGGQMQRIAIARALYKKSEILVFDEATSALDNKTETELMKAINNLSNELTIISIAHRHTTLKDYDRILKFENGLLLDDFDKKSLNLS